MRRSSQLVLLLAFLLLLPGCDARAAVARPGLCRPMGEATGAEFDRVLAQRAGELTEALRTHLREQREWSQPWAQYVQALAPCVTVAQVPGSPLAGVVSLNVPRFISGGVFIYHDGSRWYAAPLDVSGEYLQWMEPAYVITPTGQLIGHLVTPGSGAVGKLQLYRVAEPGLKRLWESPFLDQFGMAVLSPDYVLTFHRPSETYDEPHAIAANCCLPRDRETLWRRQGDRFAKVAERTYPNPYRAVSLFVGSLRRGDAATARRWAANPQVVADTARIIQQIDTSEWHHGGVPWSLAPLTERINLEEARHWSAIPEAIRGPAPAITRVTWPAGQYSLVTERQNGQWLVTALVPHTSPPSLSTNRQLTDLADHYRVPFLRTIIMY